MYNNLFNLNATIAKNLFEECNYPWEALPLIKEYILQLIPNLGEEYITINVKSWTDYQDGDQIQVTADDGTTYLVHSSNITLIKEK